jgi:OOP family OmpA-OmpF porin
MGPKKTRGQTHHKKWGQTPFVTIYKTQILFVALKPDKEKEYQNLFNNLYIFSNTSQPLTSIVLKLKMKNKYFVALLSAFLITPAFAEGNSKTYIAADVGSATYTNSGAYSANTNIVRLAGGYYFNPAFALEVGYTKFADSVYTSSTVSTTLSANAIQVAAVGFYPLNNQFDLTGKVGMSMNRVKDVGGYFSGSSTWNDSYAKTSLMYGIGAQYHMTKQLNIRAQYESFGDMTGTATALTASAISVGAMFNF